MILECSFWSELMGLVDWFVLGFELIVGFIFGFLIWFEYVFIIKEGILILWNWF